MIKKLDKTTNENIKKFLTALLISVIFYLILKELFLLLIFIIIQGAMHMLRSRITRFVAFDPVLFFALLIVKYWSWPYLLIFTFFGSLATDFYVGFVTTGTYLNTMLYYVIPFFSYILFSNISLGPFTIIVALGYGFSYFFIRVFLLGGNAFESFSKGFTLSTFTILYTVYFGQFLANLM